MLLRGLSQTGIFVRVFRKGTDRADFCLMRERKRGREKNPGESPSIIVSLSFPLEQTKKVTFGTAFGIFLIGMVRCSLKSPHPQLLSGLLAMLPLKDNHSG